jgi:hypothetical protein
MLNDISVVVDVSDVTEISLRNDPLNLIEKDLRIEFGIVLCVGKTDHGEGRRVP